MKEIDLFAGTNLDKAIDLLKMEAEKAGEPCCGEFNGKVLYSTDTVDEAYMKVLGRVGILGLKEVKMGMNEEIKVKACCALCDNLYNKEKCPLFEVYNFARNYGDETFDTEAKYKICCSSFVLNEKLRWWQKEK